MLIFLTVAIISCICISEHHAVHLKYIQLFKIYRFLIMLYVIGWIRLFSPSKRCPRPNPQKQRICYFVQQKALCTCDQIKDSEMWILSWIYLGGPNIITMVLARRRQCDNKSNNWSDAATRSVATRSWKKQGWDCHLEPSEGNNLADILTLVQQSWCCTPTFQNGKTMNLYCMKPPSQVVIFFIAVLGI